MLSTDVIGRCGGPAAVVAGHDAGRESWSCPAEHVGRPPHGVPLRYVAFINTQNVLYILRISTSCQPGIVAGFPAREASGGVKNGKAGHRVRTVGRGGCLPSRTRACSARPSDSTR